MLSDPLFVLRQPAQATFSSNSVTAEVSYPCEFSLIGSPAAGASVRVGTGFWPSPYGSEKVVMTISHSSSKENAPRGTDRSVIRFDANRIDTAGVPVVGSAYLVTAFPKGGVFTQDEQRVLVNTLAMFLLGNAVESLPAAMPDTGSVQLGQILNGIP